MSKVWIVWAPGSFIIGVFRSKESAEYCRDEVKDRYMEEHSVWP